MFLLTISDCHFSFQHFNFKTDFPENENLYQKTGIPFFRTWCKSGTRTTGPGTSRPWTGDPGPPQSLKVEPGTPLKIKSRTPGPSSKFKSGTLIIILLHCLTYFVPDKYLYNMEIIPHD